MVIIELFHYQLQRFSFRGQAYIETRQRDKTRNYSRTFAISNIYEKLEANNNTKFTHLFFFGTYFD